MQRLLPLLLSGLLLFAIAGCDSTTPSAQEADDRLADEPTLLSLTIQDTQVQPPLTLGYFKICKVAPDDPAFVFDFGVGVTGPGAANNTSLVPTANLAHLQCQLMYEAPRTNIIGPDEVTATEFIPDGWTLDRVELFVIEQIDGQEVVTTTTVSGPDVTTQVLGQKRGATAVFYNSPGIIGGEGCTPGAWKNRLLRLDRWPVSPDTPVGDVWSATPAELAGFTLLEALSFRGGNTFNDKVEILLRAATAGYLNSLTVNYDLRTQQIIDGGNAAIASGDQNQVIDLATTLDDFNNQVCEITNR